MIEAVKGLTSLGQGRNREAFLTKRGKYIIKVPLNEAGWSDNLIEVTDYERNRFLGREYMARCRMVVLSGVPCLIMERVDPVTSLKGLPEWTDFVDCRQVGYNRKGKLVAYDWA